MLFRKTNDLLRFTSSIIISINSLLGPNGAGKTITITQENLPVRLS